MKTITNFKHSGQPVKEPYHYTECGLDDVYLVSGHTRETTNYGEGVTISHVDELHKAIGHFLVTQKKNLSGKELRFLRKEMDLTQAELGAKVGLSDQQVARWEKDKYEIPTSADYLVRYYYLKHINAKQDLEALIEALHTMDAQLCNQIVLKISSDGWKPRFADVA